MGCYQSGVTLTAQAVGEQHGCPFITANATSDNLTAQGYEYFFRLAPTNMMFLRDMVQFCKTYSDENNLGLSTVAICVDNTEVGQETINYAEYWCEQEGLEIVGTVTHPSGASDLSSEVLQLKQLNADILIADQYVSDAILLTNTMLEQDYKPGLMIVKANGYTEADYVASVGNKLNGIMMATEFIEGSRGQDISDAYKEFSGEALNGHSAEAFTVVYTIAEAVHNIAERGEEVTRDTLQQELSQISIQEKFCFGGHGSKSVFLVQTFLKLTPEEAVERIGDSFYFNCREIGSGDTGRETLYEFLDGMDPYEKKLHLVTREAFERGVRDYRAGSYFTARKYFADVLQTNERDSTAMYYLMLCDTHLHEQAALSR